MNIKVSILVRIEEDSGLLMRKKDIFIWWYFLSISVYLWFIGGFDI